MSRHDPMTRVRHMLDHAQEARDMAVDRQRSDLDTDRQFELSLVRLMEIVGEAASRVPPEFRQQYPDVPWRDISDFRNRLIHGYDEVDLDVLWKIITDELDPLIQDLEAIIRDHH